MPQFFTYEDRLELQKGLKEDLLLKTIHLKLLQSIQGFCLMNARIGLTSAKRIFAERNVSENFVPIANFAVIAMSIARVLYAKPALHVFGLPMCAMAVKQSASVP